MPLPEQKLGKALLSWPSVHMPMVLEVAEERCRPEGFWAWGGPAPQDEEAEGCCCGWRQSSLHWAPGLRSNPQCARAWGLNTPKKGGLGRGPSGPAHVLRQASSFLGCWGRIAGRGLSPSLLQLVPGGSTGDSGEVAWLGGAGSGPPPGHVLNLGL